MLFSCMYFSCMCSACIKIACAYNQAFTVLKKFNLERNKKIEKIIFLLKIYVSIFKTAPLNYHWNQEYFIILKI